MLCAHYTNNYLRNVLGDDPQLLNTVVVLQLVRTIKNIPPTTNVSSPKQNNTHYNSGYCTHVTHYIQEHSFDTNQPIIIHIKIFE